MVEILVVIIILVSIKMVMVAVITLVDLTVDMVVEVADFVVDMAAVEVVVDVAVDKAPPSFVPLAWKGMLCSVITARSVIKSTTSSSTVHTGMIPTSHQKKTEGLGCSGVGHCNERDTSNFCTTRR